MHGSKAPPAKLITPGGLTIGTKKKKEKIITTLKIQKLEGLESS